MNATPWLGKALVLLFAIACLSVRVPAAAGGADKSSNVELIANFPYKTAQGAFYSGTDIAFDGNYAYAAQLGRFGGIHIFDVSAGKPREVSFVACPGTQNDVAVVDKGIVALGYHRSDCGRARHGVQLIDVKNPHRPRFLGSVSIPGDGTHTLTPYPGRPLVYSSPGGPGGEDAESIIDVSDPRKPRIVASFDPGPQVGCHDVSFRVVGERKLGFCAGGNATQIWDVSDPLEPRIISQIINPMIFFHHSVAATPDGKYLVVGDEGVGSCTGASKPTGALYVYDITRPDRPLLVSYFGLHRTEPLICTAHNFDFIPRTRTLVASWYRGGMNVIDLTDPAQPRELAHYQSDTTDYWSAYWYRNRVYANGLTGLDVFDVKR